MNKNKRVCITTDRLNSYGTRVLTSGMDISQYERNPVLLYMHQRGNVIGYVKDLQVEGNALSGELVFDEASEQSVRCKKQYEFGSLRMVSCGLDILELSDSPADIVLGQTRPTISKSKLFEVSLVDIGANDDAIVMQKDGKKIELGKDGESLLPLLNLKKEEEKMDMKTLALELGLPEGADDAAISAKIAELQSSEEARVSLAKENAALVEARDALTLSAITSAVETAIREKRIGEEKKQQFIELGKKVGIDELTNIFGAMSPQVKLSAVIGHHGGSASSGSVEWKKLSDVPSEKILELRKEDPATYKRLYAAEYGMEAEMDD